MDKILDLDILSMAYKTTIAFVNRIKSTDWLKISDYQKLILNLNSSLKNSLLVANFLAHVASLAYPEYSDEEIKLLLGIEKECITFNNSDNLENIFALKENAHKRNKS